jgi:cytochrome c553
VTSRKRSSSGRSSWPVARRWTLLAATLVLAWAGAGEAQDLERGREEFQLCGACHGTAGQGNEQYGAPVIAGLPLWYVEAQLTKFKQGMRGFRAEDTRGLQMRPMARSLMTEADLKSVAAYVASLPAPARPAPTLKGDPAKGQASFAVCIACHGPQAKGNEALGAPILTRQADWYLVAQIKKFRQGLRGTHPTDVRGGQMRPMAMTLADDQAILDVVAYIRSLPD